MRRVRGQGLGFREQSKGLRLEERKTGVLGQASSCAYAFELLQGQIAPDTFEGASCKYL